MVEIRKYIASILILSLLCSLLPSYTGATLGAIIGKGPWYVRTVVAIAGVWTTKKIQKLGNGIKNKNKGNGVYIIYGASYRSDKI
ncbi:hypothetical protein E2R55_23785 [Vibrio vulnificus]|nr:hypothetical protein E2R55_23785 [Vibrio vulnificus]